MCISGLHCCGPVPHRAIKEGDLYIPYDAQFVFSEVNGDAITWMAKGNGHMVPLKHLSEFSAIGKKISTKAVGSNEREDITHLYKYREGITIFLIILKKKTILRRLLGVILVSSYHS